MNRKTKIWALMIGLAAVAFAAGWLVAEVQNVDKLDPREVIANRWVGDLGLLVDNVRHLKPVDPKTTQSIIRLGLDNESVMLAQLYDDMSPHLKDMLAFYIPSARAIAAAQPSTGLGFQDRHTLLIFANCMQKVRSQGGSVDKCVKDRMAAEKTAARD